MMRRMGGQAGGGAGQIFNIGKSKAQLFDKDTKGECNLPRRGRFGGGQSGGHGDC